MATITEDYCSYEVAKLLKEKGFPQEYDVYHSMVYNEEDYEDEYEVQRMVLETKLVKSGTLSSYPISVPEPKCYCCTLSMAMKWLREVHNIFIVIEPHMYNYINEKISSYVTSLWQGDNYCENITSKDYSTYEEAVEATLKYALENLI